MRNIKDIFKVIIVIQLLTCALAFYGHPDAETIDFGSPTQPSRDQLIIEAAIKRGMDGEAVAELLRTKKPVVKTTVTPNGFTKTTTYKLESDGSISSKSVLQKRNRYVYNSGNIPDSIPIDELKNSPTGTITRTFTDSDGNKVTQTVGVNKPKPATVMDNDDLTGDWFNKPFGSWPQETPVSTPTSTVHRTITRTYTGPNGERRTVQTWSSDPELSEPEQPFALAPHIPSNSNTGTRTYITPNGEKHVLHTPFNNPELGTPKFPSIGNINWPSFDYSSYAHPWEAAEPEDEEGWEVVENPKVETTTKRKLEAWTPRTWEWPEFPTRPTTTTTTTTTTTAKPQTNTPKPLPSLEDFLKSQYGAPTSTTAKTQTSTKKSLTTTTTTTNKPQVINIEDLPVMEVLHNGKPANETILKSLPEHLTPKTKTEEIFKIEHIHPIEEDVEVSTPKEETNIRTFSKTHTGPEKPTLKDLNPQMYEVLRKSGINPDEIATVDGDPIIKTHKEPDGRIITTTFRVTSVPSSPVEHVPAQHHYASPKVPAYAQHFNTYKPIVPSLMPFTPQTQHLSPISEFLAKFGLTKFDITSRSGHYTKTLIDDNGDVLTATFVLSSPRGKRSPENPIAKPLK